MKEIKIKLEQLTYEIKLVKSDEPDNMTGVMIRLEELTDLINKLLIPIFARQSEQLCPKCKSLNLEMDYGLGKLYCHNCEDIVGHNCLQ